VSLLIHGFKTTESTPAATARNTPEENAIALPLKSGPPTFAVFKTLIPAMSRGEAWHWGFFGGDAETTATGDLCESRKAMIPSIRKRLPLAKGLEEVTYNCVFCRATTVRSIKPDDSNEPDEQ
jgi:hypothetical protein